MSWIFDHLIPAASAHEKWFVSANDASVGMPDFYHQYNSWTAGAIVVFMAVIVAGYFIDRKFEASDFYQKIEGRVAPYRDYVAGFLAVTTGIALLWGAFHGTLLADNFVIASGTLSGRLLLWMEGIVGILLLIGLFTPAAALGILALYGGALGMFGVVEALDYLHYVGIAVFLLAFSRGKFSLDWMLGKDFISRPKERRMAYLALRIFTGLTFMILAFWKWYTPGLHFALIAKFPDFNPLVILQALGLAISSEHYVFMLFVVEMIVGIAVLGGYLTRIASVMLVPLMTGSVIFLGWEEIVGHVPILGILAVLFVFGDTYHKETNIDDMPTRVVPVEAERSIDRTVKGSRRQPPSV